MAIFVGHSALMVSVRCADGCPAAEVRLGLSEVSLLDVPSLSVIVEVRRILVVDGHRLIIVSPVLPVRRIFDVTGLYRVLDCDNIRAGGYFGHTGEQPLRHLTSRSR